MKTIATVLGMAGLGLCLTAGCLAPPRPAELSVTQRQTYVDKEGESLWNKLKSESAETLPGRVVELRGDNGELARVSLGRTRGAVAGTAVEFYVFADYSELVPGAKREPSVIGYGQVTESEERFAWVQVSDPAKANIQRGHYVRIAAVQPQGFFDKVKGLFKGKKKK